MKNPRPRTPYFFRKLVAWATAPEDRPFVLGDLDEEFDQRAKHQLSKARWWYRGQALRSSMAGLGARRSWRRIRSQANSTDASSRSASGRIEQPPPIWQMSLNALGAAAGDLRYAVRHTVRHPLSTLVVIASLGLGIGAVTATFTLLNSLMFQAPVGISDPSTLVSIYTHEPGEKTYGSTSYADFEEISDRVPAIDEAAAVTLRSLAYGRQGAFNVLAEEVSANYFKVTGMRLHLGRPFSSATTQIKSSVPVAILGYDFWVREFDADPQVIGKTIHLDSRTFTVLGVALAKVVSRRAPLAPDVWVPLGAVDTGPRAESFRSRLQDRDRRPYLVLGRLNPAATFPELEAQLETASATLSEEQPAWSDTSGRTRRFVALPEKKSRVNPHAQTLFLAVGGFLIGVTSLVLLIACANVASLVMARTAARRGEFALRTSLGASRSRVVGMLLMEGFLPTLAGVGVALLVTRMITWRINSIDLPNAFPLKLATTVDVRVLVFAFAVAFASWLGFCLFPALRGTHRDLQSSLKTRGPGRRRGLPRARTTIVALQCAASLILIVGASLFLRSLQSASNLDLGLTPDGVAVVSKRLADDEYGPEQALRRFDEIRESLMAAPGVEEAAYASGVELTLAQIPREEKIRTAFSRGGEGREDTVAIRNLVSPGYLKLLRVPILSGRGFSEADARGALPVAVVNEAFAQQHWSEADVVGRSFEVVNQSPSAKGSVTAYRVIGKARNGKYVDFDDGAEPYFWTPFAQDPGHDVVILIKGSRSAEDLAVLLERKVPLAPGEVRRVAPSSLSSQLSVQFSHLRIASTLLGLGGFLGLFLAVIGIYGLVNLAVGERAKEMAIRLAVGASQAMIFRALVLDGLRSALLGLALGLCLALPAARLLGSVLWGVGSTDLASFLFGAVLLVFVAFCASALPARRLLAKSPIQSLRED